MRILMVTQQMDIGGTETHLVQICRQLKARGHRVTVVSAGGSLVSLLRKDNIEHLTLPLDKKDPFSSLKNRFGLKKILKGTHYDIVHSHARIPSYHLSRLSSSVDFRWVTTCHGIYRENAITRRLHLWGDATLAVSDDVKAYLKNVYHLSGDRIYPVVNGIDTDLFSPSPEEKPFARRIIAVSRITTQTVRPLLELCRAIPVLAKDFPDVSLTVVGDGDASGELRSEAAAVNGELKRAAVLLTGSEKNVERRLREADIFVGVSRAAFEAMSCGLPVVLSGAQGFSGILTDENRASELTSNYCCRGNEPATSRVLAGVLSKLLRNPKWAIALGKENRAFVRETLSVEKMTDMYEDFYLNLPLRRFFPKADILLSGYFGYQNAGDDETIRSFLYEISRKAPDLRVMVLSSHTRSASEFYQVRCFNRFRFLGVYRWLRKSRMFVACGGSLLQDATSLRSLFYYASLFRMADLAGCGKAIYAAGIGPLSRERSRKTVARIARSVDHLSLRDEGSARLIREICGPRIPLRVTSDTVFLADPVDFPAGDEFGLSLRQSRIDFPDSADFEPFLDKLGVAVEQLREKTGKTPVVLVMHPNSDEEISRAFAEKHHLRICRGGEVLPVAHRCAFVVSMRLHTLLFAVTEGHPAFGLSADPKVQNLLLPFALPTVLPKDFDPEAFVALVLHSLDEKRFSSESLKEAAKKQRQKAREDFELLLSELR